MLFRHGGRTGLLVAIVIALLGALTVPAVGQVPDLKTYTADIDGTGAAAPDVYAGDADAGITITITNTSANQSLGSADVTVPAPFALVGAAADTVPGGPLIELRFLALGPGESATFPVTVDVRTCAPTAAPTFDVQVKQSNEFSGTGNDFFPDPQRASDRVVAVSGVCALEFERQPADAERAATITSVDYAPAGAPITVEVRDAGDTGRATHATSQITLDAFHPVVEQPLLAGTTSATAVAGLAEFSPGPSLAPSASAYVLDAEGHAEDGTTNLDPATSEPFDIVDDQVDCPAGQPCRGAATASANGQSVSARFGGGGNAASLVVSLGAADVPAFVCAGYQPDAVRQAAQFLFAGGDGSDRLGTVSLVLPNASQPANAYEVCWAAPYTFATDGGGDATVGAVKPVSGEELYVGILPDCARRGEPARPCVSGRSFNRRTAELTIVVETTGEDPWARS